ncbi:MAG TPA: class E sortase [Actinomycetota bacterium]|nr:class E sortase [Actinomycetota bacterium]
MALTMRGRRILALSLASLAVVTAVGAAGFVAYPFYTDWQAGRTQTDLRAAFGSDELKEAYRNRRVGDAQPLTRITIPAMKTDTIVVEGTSAKALNTGAGHYPNTPLPGEPGNVAIAGHRTTYGKPFANLEILKPGDKVFLETPFAKHTYEVVPAFGGHQNPWVVAANDWSVAEQAPESMLTLTTCHPRGSDRQRLVARAKLVKSEPLA